MVTNRVRNGSRSLKKGGGGGKYTVGRPGDEMLDVELDPLDPGYTSEDDIILVSKEMLLAHSSKLAGIDVSDSGVVHGFNYRKKLLHHNDESNSNMSLSDYKTEVISAIGEYFVSSDGEELSRRVSDIKCPNFACELVKRMITKAMSSKLRECELVSQFMSSTYGNLLDTDDIAKGFELLFESIDDLQLDVPKAKKILANFLARAVVDEVLPPSFLSDKTVEKNGGDAVTHAKTLLSMKHGMARLEHVWGPGDGRSVDELKDTIKDTLHEYLLSQDLGEAARCISELNSPYFHHEVIKRGIVIVMDHSEEQEIMMSSLFAYLCSQEVTSEKMIEQGFQRIKDEMPDICLDVPFAPKKFEGFVERAKADSILPSTFSL